LKAQADIVEKIHEIPGFETFETFLGRQSFAELRSAAKYGPVIVVNCSRHWSDALIIVACPNPHGQEFYGQEFYDEVITIVDNCCAAAQ
jgi:hypothetical protein